jgi:flagellar M-ring protein FliF
VPIAQLASRLTARGWLIGGGAVAVGILFIYFFLHLVSQPSYSTLASGLDPSQTGKMTSTLSADGINYQLQNNGTALAVQSNQTSQARVALAGADELGNSGSEGFKLFEKSKLGESNFQQQVTYQRALQGQLEETINSVEGVSGAQVELVLPSSQSQIFGENQEVSSAAVLLSGTSSLDPSSVRGIAQLVSSSVPGLQLSKVTITNSTGQLLWPASGGGGAGGQGTSVQEAEQRYDNSMEASLDAMLAQTVGVGKAQVLVYANMNVDQTTKESLEYGKAGVPLQQTKSLETLSGTGSGAGGTTGTANVTTGTGASSGKSNYKKESTSSSLGVSKVVTHSTVAPGAIESQHVSVLLDHSVPAASLPAIKEAITNAAGIQAKRGDTISIGQVAFPKATATTAAAASPLGDAKYAVIGLAAIIFLFLTTRSLRKREKEAIEEPVWLRELDAPMRLSELEREISKRPNEMMAGVGPNGSAPANGAAPAGSDIRRQVEQLADSDPDRVAQQLRTWMQED